MENLQRQIDELEVDIKKSVVRLNMNSKILSEEKKNDLKRDIDNKEREMLRLVDKLRRMTI